MEFVADIYKLTQKFIDDFPSSNYPELMHKVGRPYSCLLVDMHLDYYICIPFRSHINHKNSYMLRNTQRSKNSKSGLDFSRMVLLKDGEYLDNKKVVVDQDEYNEVQKNIDLIVEKAIEYL